MSKNFEEGQWNGHVDAVENEAQVPFAALVFGLMVAVVLGLFLGAEAQGWLRYLGYWMVFAGVGSLVTVASPRLYRSIMQD